MRGNFNKLAKWPAAVAKVGQPDLHLHDLRHTGNTLAARIGASARDLMARMGDDSPQAAMIYQHATAEAGPGHRGRAARSVEAERKEAKKAGKKAAK